MVKVLVIEDNLDINAMLVDALGQVGYEVVSAYSGTEGKLQVAFQSFDIVLLDLMLPGMSGEELLLEIRKLTNTPIIVMSAKSAIDTKVKLLKSGADDYLVKPFDLKELIARIEVQVKKFYRQNSQEELNYSAGDLLFSPSTLLITYKGEELNLTKQENKILELFIKNPRKIFTKQEIFESAWDDYYLGDDKTINVHVSNMRKKLKEQTGEEWLETVWGVGFRIIPTLLDE